MTARVSIVSTVRDAARDLQRFANYHLNAGIEAILLYADAPAEWTDAMSGSSRVHIVMCDDEYWAARGGRPANLQRRQAINANDAFGRARQLGFDWMMHIDQDELVVARERTIAELLAERTRQAVRFELREAIPTRVLYESRFDAQDFKIKVPESRLVPYRNRPELSRLFFEGGFFRGHSDSKCAYRVRDFEGRVGVHGPLGTDRPVGHTPDLLLLHFDCIGESDWRTKWLLRRENVGADGMRANRKVQMNLFNASLGDPEAQSKLYEDIYVVPQEQVDAAIAEGIVESIRLDPDWFAPPQAPLGIGAGEVHP